MTRKVLRFLGSRYGIGVVLLVAVIVIVSIARANGGSRPGTTGSNSDSNIGTEDAGEPNDGVVDTESEKPQLPQEAIDVATDFAEAYIDTDQSAEKWRNGWGKNATEQVKEQLEDVGPEAVQIREIQDEPTVEGQTVKFPTDAGLLILRVKEQDGVWLVDGIDFAKS